MSAPFCPPCRDFLLRHRVPLRHVAVLLLVALFFYWVGQNAPTVASPLMCKIYG